MPSNEHWLYELLREVGLTDRGATLLENPLKIVFIVLVAIVAARFGARLARRFVHSIGTQSALYIASARTEQRIRTIGGVVASLVRIIVWAVAVMYVFEMLGFNLG